MPPLQVAIVYLHAFPFDQNSQRQHELGDIKGRPSVYGWLGNIARSTKENKYVDRDEERDSKLIADRVKTHIRPVC